MFRKYVIISLAALMSFSFMACTSKKAEEGADVEMASGDEALEEADAVGNNDDLSMDSGGGDVASDLDSGGSDDLGDDLGGDLESAAADPGSGEVTPNDLSEAPPADNSGFDAAATDTPPPADDMAGMDAPPSDDMGGDMAATDTAPPPEPESAPAPPIVPEPSGMDSEPATPVVGSLKKINSLPYKHGKINVNAVYIARDGDTVESIAQKVGSDVKTICKINAYNCGRGIKVGDKYYYNSPQRPTDDSVVKTYYEDNGIPPEIYTAKAGDNIRKVSKELLGHDRSWMEVWATNDVESKQDLDEGTQLKYWPSTSVPTQTMAGTDPSSAPPDDGSAPPMDTAAPPEGEAPPPPGDMAAAPPMDGMAPPSGDMGAPPPPGDMGAPPPPPPPPDMAQNDLPPVPDPNMAGTVEPPPPPPPPPPTDTAPVGGDMAMDSVQDPDQTMMLGVGAVLLLAAAALFISIRKKRQRRQIDFNTTTQTQIE